ncbi:MAG: hypothetical protein VKK63_08465 [Synechococcus sp.]|nr:hypothetical protein [Synechococcus sp.]
MTSASFDAYCKLVTKHVLGDPTAFNELVESLAACEHAKSKSVAAALGYLVAMEDKKEEERCIYDKVLEQVDNGYGDPAIRTDAIMTEVYCWLDKEMEEEGYGEDGEVRGLLLDRFTPYIVSSNLDRK